MRLPDPEERPLITVDELVELVPALGCRATIYAACAAGQIPSLRVGRRLFVPVGELRRRLGIDPVHDEGAPAQGAHVVSLMTAPTAEQASRGTG